MVEEKINYFLKFGFFNDYENKDVKIDFSNIDKELYKDVNADELIKKGSKILLEAISINFDVSENILLPISGGLDSRSILSGLLKHTEAKNISTYTFGTPKTFDYEIGNYIAKKLGTKHTSFDLTKHIYKQNELEDIAKRVGNQAVLFHHAPVWQVDSLFKNHTIWSGFFGDALSGLKTAHIKSDSQEKAVETYIKNNTYSKSMNIVNQDFKKYFSTKYNGKLSYDDYLFFEFAVKKSEIPLVLMNGYKYKIPLIDKDWVNFMLSIPNEYRVNQYLYKEILLYTFPKEFSYKIKTNIGLPLKASKPIVFAKRVQDKLVRMSGFGTPKGINYLDFNKQIREKTDLREIFKNNIMDLKSRNIIDWIDIEKILYDHLSKKGNYADALIPLASLEIHLKSGLKL